MDNPNGLQHILAWLANVEPGVPDIPLISNVSPQQPEDNNSTGEAAPHRLRGAPDPLPTIDTTISNSIEEVTLRRGAESLPELSVERIVSRFKPVVTTPDLSSHDSSPSSPKGTSASPKKDPTPSGGAALRCREIRPEDFLRDPRQTFTPRTKSQKEARRERFITQMQLEVDENVTELDTLHAFMRHSIMAVPPPSKWHDCRCPGGSTVPVLDRSAAFDETPIPDEDESPGYDTDSNCSDRFALSDDSENEHVGTGGRPTERGIEARPIHQDGSLATLVRLSEQGYTDALLTTLEKRTPDKTEDFGMFNDTSGYIPIWLEGVSPSYSPWTSPMGIGPPLRPWTDFEQATVFFKPTLRVGSEINSDFERDLADGLAVEEFEMEVMDAEAVLRHLRMEATQREDIAHDTREEDTAPLIPKPVRKSRFIEDLPESNPNYRPSTDENERRFIEGAMPWCDIERGIVADEGKKPVTRRSWKNKLLVVIALLLMLCAGLLIFLAVQVKKGD